MIHIQITEGRSAGKLRDNLKNSVRVFIRGEHSYGYWMDESRLYDLLDKEQKTQYFQHDPIIWEFYVSKDVANIIKARRY
jgi:hypothetical protein